MKHDYVGTQFKVSTTFRYLDKIVSIESPWHATLPGAMALLGEACRDYAHDMFMRGNNFHVTLDEVQE
jgi:hypothetical protein